MEVSTGTAPVSVIVPTHDRWWSLPRALDSILSQTRPAAEILVVDDGSTDGTGEHVAASYPSVRLIRQENRGVSAARNAGILASTRPWIAFLDSDDAWRPEKLEAQFREAENGNPARLIHTGEIWIRNGRRVNPGERHRKRGGRIFEQCLDLCAISPSAALIRREVFDEVGGFDEDLPACEDYDLWLRLTCREPVGLVDAPLVVKHGGHDDQLSREPALDRYRIRALETLLRRAPLDPAQRRATLVTLLAKSGVYLAGVEKRGRDEEAAHLRASRETWCRELERG